MIFLLSALRGDEVSPWMPHIPEWDKVCHVLAFGVGATILAWTLWKTHTLRWRVIVPLVIVIVSLYGATDEWHQQFTPGRSAKDVGDWLADTTGATLGALFAYVRFRKKPRASRPAPPGD